MTIPAFGGFFANSVTKKIAQAAVFTLAITKASAEALSSTAQDYIRNNTNTGGNEPEKSYRELGFYVAILAFGVAGAAGVFLYRNRDRRNYDAIDGNGQRTGDVDITYRSQADATGVPSQQSP